MEQITVIYPEAKQPYYKILYNNELIYSSKYKDRFEKFYEFLKKEISKND